jgi:DMSO/TMAO reductase YedYZ molybdopterin-dependent catalytic subunit
MIPDETKPLAGDLPPGPDEPDGQTRNYGRRGFLVLVAGGLSSLAWAGPMSRLLAPLTSNASQLLGNLLPVGGWRIYTISGTMPLFDTASWRLEIDGLVRRPRSISYAELKALPRAEQISSFHCVTGWTVNNVHWGGVRFQQLFDLVQPLPMATAVRFVSLERPYEDSLTLEQLRFADAMLAYEMGGRPLSRPHGAPARVVLPEMYGYKGVKWLTKMEFVAHQPKGYWEQNGYDQNAWVGNSNGHHS